MKLQNQILVLTSVVAFAGCGLVEQDKSAEYYVNHQTEIQPKIAQCAKDSGVKNCESAEQAAVYLKRQAYIEQAAKDKEQVMNFFAPPKKH